MSIGSGGEKEIDKYLLIGGAALFFIILIVLAFVYRPSGVAQVGVTLGQDFLAPFKAVIFGIYGLIVHFFQWIISSIEGAFKSLFHL